jgi:predicted secreted protein
VVVLFVLPPAAYPVSFWVALVAVVAVGIRERRNPDEAKAGATPGAAA